ncbi:MAG: methyltransferase [Bacteroidia bacterium]
METSLQSGKSAFERIYGQPFFTYLHAQKLDLYHKATAQYAQDDSKDLPTQVDFNLFSSVMDVGGGYGILLKNLQARYPDITYFDLPQVVANVNLPGIQKIGGNFFEPIPAVAECLILSP